MKVLVVDDEMVLRMVIADMMKSLGFEVIVAEDGLDALEQFRTNTSIRLVLSDVCMPRMTGNELHEQIRGPLKERGGRFIAATGGCPDPVRKYFEREEVRVLSKPFSLCDIRRCMV